MSDKRRHVIAPADLSGDDVEWIVERSLWRIRDGNLEQRSDAGVSAPFTAVLVFLEPSLRTRLGFTIAAQRLGGQASDVLASRFRGDMSTPETFEDTLRVASDMADVVIVRMPDDLPGSLIRSEIRAAVINGGDGSHHPTQALIDLVAIRKAFGPRRPLRIALCGDLTMRAARSLIDVLRHDRSLEIELRAPQSRIPDELLRMSAAQFREGPLETDGIDVLYMVGLPARKGSDELTQAERELYSLTPDRISALPERSVVLSPMPVIDEIAPPCMSDPRVRVFEQSRDGLAVRMAVLEYVLGYR